MKLVIAEKPSVAGEIAKITGASKKEQGYFTGNGYIVSWCVGHLITLAEPEQYDPSLKKWSLDTLPIIPAKYKTAVLPKTAAQYKVLNSLIKREDVTELICATDAGREGELIFRLVYYRTGTDKPFKRLWISSMEEKAIKDGFKNLKDSSYYDNLFMSALCRQRADWLVGMNITRLYSLVYNKLLHAGRVQTPTINLIVKRSLEIQNFVVRTYYTVIADLGSFKAESKDFDDVAAADALAALCKGKEAVVVKIGQETKRENPPALYDLTTLQRDANRIFGYSAKMTLDIAQNLYEKKLITYPRTDSRYLTSDMDSTAASLVKSLAATEIIDLGLASVYDMSCVSVSQMINNKKVTDHHAIIPTESAAKPAVERLTVPEKNIFTLVALRLLTAPYSPHIYKLTKVLLNIEGEMFKAIGKEILQDGFKILERQAKNIFKPQDKSQKGIKSDKNEKDEGEILNTILPPMSVGDKFIVKDASVKTKNTQPPKPYTEDTLLSAMETAGKSITDEELKEAIKDSGLGTPATRAGIIENIIKSGYIIRDKKQLLPTETAFTFISLVNDKLKEPEMTAEWEKLLEQISKGTYNSQDFMDSISSYVRELVESKKQIDPAQTKNLFKADGEREIIGKCPKCKKNIYEFNKGYFCESGKGGCGFIIWKTVAGRIITKTQAKKLLSKRKTDLIKGFKSKTGKEFNAFLILKDDNTTGFDFEKK